MLQILVNTNFDFVRWRRWAYLISGVAIAISVGQFASPRCVWPTLMATELRGGGNRLREGSRTPHALDRGSHPVGQAGYELPAPPAPAALFAPPARAFSPAARFLSYSC